MSEEKTLFGYPIVEVDNLLGKDIDLTITFERSLIATALTRPYRAPTIEEFKALSKKYRRFMNYRRRYARGKR